MGFLELLVGRDGTDLSFVQMAARGVLVFAVALGLLRVASRRFLGRYSPFDWLLTIVLGSVLSRTINGGSAFLPTLGVSALLVGLHYALGALALRSRRLSTILHGEPLVIVDHGRLVEPVARHNHLTLDDVREELRCQVQVDRVDQIARAILERNGRITVVRDPGEREPGDSLSASAPTIGSRARSGRA